MTIVFVLVGAAMIASAILAGYAWWRRSTPGAGPFALLMFAIAFWCFGVLFGLASQDLPNKLFWAKVVFFGLTTVPVAWVLFVVEYTGRAQWLSPRNIFILFIIPLATTALAWTNEWHGLIYPTARIDNGSGYPLIQVTFGSWMAVHAIYSYGLIVVGVFLLAWTTFRLPQVYRRQATLLLLGSLIPFISNIISISGINPLPALDFTPIAFALTGSVFAWGLFRFGLLDLVPVARDLVIEQMLDGVIVLDARDRILDANPAFQRIMGIPMNQIIGQPADALLPQWRRLASPDQTEAVRHEITLTTSAGSSNHVVRISPLLDQRRRLTGRVVNIHDVTDLKRVEKELALAKESAEASDRAKSNFLATVSFEFRTPLTTINGYSNTLLAEVNENGPRNLAGYIERINTASQHMLAIVNRLVDLTKIEMGTMPLQLRVFDFSGVVQEAVHAMQPIADKNHNTIRVTRPDALGMHADKDKVQQIVFTLLDNACKYTHQGEIRVTVERESSEHSDWVNLAIQDNGQGISPRHLENLFEPFTQANSSHVRDFGGTGLSLALGQRYCKMMHGTISVKSEQGVGATFVVRLPVNVEPETSRP